MTECIIGHMRSVWVVEITFGGLQ